MPHGLGERNIRNNKSLARAMFAGPRGTVRRQYTLQATCKLVALAGSSSARIAIQLPHLSRDHLGQAADFERAAVGMLTSQR